jgi:hypothetical protein
LGLSVLHAIDLGTMNMAMQYVNYPAKTLMKSSPVIFIMLFDLFVNMEIIGETASASAVQEMAKCRVVGAIVIATLCRAAQQ